jgi:hypothetical protein
VLRFISVDRGAIAQGFGSDFFGTSAQAPTNIFPRQAKCPSVAVNSAECDVNVRMLSVVMDGGDPVELFAQVALHPSHQLPSVLLKVQMVSEFRRYNDFEDTLVSSTLPIVELSCDV